MAKFMRKKISRRRTTKGKKLIRRLKKRAVAPSSNIARVVERLPVNYDISGETSFNFTTRLSSYARALGISNNYKYYRCASVKFSFKPTVPVGGTTLGGTTGGPQMYAFYWKMNRAGYAPDNNNENWFLQNNAKPISFGSSTGKQVIIKYKPNLLNSIGTDPNGTAQTTSPLFNRWVSTIVEAPGGADSLNSNVPYFGLLTFIANPGGGTTVLSQVASLTVEAVWEFKDPYITPSGPPQPSISLAV